jgi:hypothetical protein
MELPIQQAVQQVGNQIVAEMRATLQRNGNDNKGAKLSNSITATVVKDNLVISMLNYGQWVNDGHERGSGKKPPIKAINAWILKAHITPKQGITAKQLPWVIQAAIGKKGQTHRRKFPFIEPSIQTVLAKDLDGIFGKAIDTVAQQYYKTK